MKFARWMVVGLGVAVGGSLAGCKDKAEEPVKVEEGESKPAADGPTKEAEAKPDDDKKAEEAKAEDPKPDEKADGDKAEDGAEAKADDTNADDKGADDKGDAKADDKAGDKAGDGDETAKADETDKPAGTTPTTGTPVAVRSTGDSIGGCCAALSASKGTSDPARINRAVGLCYALDTKVKTGKSTRASALQQIRALAGGSTPASCN
ncbi:MAG: hypothetical protein KC731_13545 [Myxococcales bacterium]|nr:hypothetical protein [Myxococcales bacterium]